VNAESITPWEPGKSRPAIAILPEYAMSNAYLARMREVLSAVADIQPLQGRARLRRMLRGEPARLDFVVTNWADNALITASGRLSLTGLVRFLLRVAQLKLLARAVIFVRHNRYPHSTRLHSARRAERIVDWCESLFDGVFSHSGARQAAPGGRWFYVPHPLYHSAPIGSHADSFPEPYFVVFGRILPYKRLEDLMRRFPDRRVLVIVGEAGDARYADMLRGIRKGNVVFSPGYREEPELRAVLSRATGVVIPNADPDVIVSGTFFYAMTMRKPVFALRTPFLEWVRGRLGQDAVFLGQDLEELCALIRDAPQPSSSADTVGRIEAEFGDAAVRTAVMEAFAAIGGR
jgi:glycosyltransferase involved in cell wall biosynthesis